MKNIKDRTNFISNKEQDKNVSLTLSPEEEKALLGFKLAASQENEQKYLLLGVIINSFGINLDEFIQYYNTFWVDSRLS